MQLSNLFKNDEQSDESEQDPYADYDPFEPKEDPYQKLLRKQKERKQLRKKIANVTFGLAVLVAMFNFTASFLAIENLMSKFVIYTYPLAFILLALTIYFGINPVGEERELSVGIKLLFLPIILTLFVFRADIFGFYDFASIVKNVTRLQSIAFLFASLMLLLLTGIMKDRVRFNKDHIAYAGLLTLSVFLSALAFGLPVFAG